MPEIIVVTEKISKQTLREMAKGLFGDLIKAVVDIKREIMAIGGELHADEEEILLEQGSAQADVWGVNLYPDETEEKWIEFDAMINIRPSAGNRSRGVDDPQIRQKIREVVFKLVE